MFLIFLKFADKSRAPDLMAAHNAWLSQGFDDGAFLVSGTLQPGLGGAILATEKSRATVEARIAADPFVAQGVVTPEIHEITASKANPRLDFLLA
ncbi:YciI family protein [Marimonas arenosa]|uniref:YciI family protein n=1 Tax=Marimonas arenosa TaxID=1795305 RepID=A0AAE3WCH1_9RHOB|nr:YciI family protein [Marimonas arenosa]MDQ2090177.1 YciI family protein [Marimonas arenosa]